MPSNKQKSRSARFLSRGLRRAGKLLGEVEIRFPSLGHTVKGIPAYDNVEGDEPSTLVVCVDKAQFEHGFPKDGDRSWVTQEDGKDKCWRVQAIRGLNDPGASHLDIRFVDGNSRVR